MSDEAQHNAALVASFFRDLRDLRASSGLSYRQMSRIVHYSHTSLHNIVGGAHFPPLDRLQAFVTACGGDVDLWTQRWREAQAVFPVRGEAFDTARGSQELSQFKQSLLALVRKTQGVSERSIAAQFGRSPTWIAIQLKPGSGLPSWELVLCIIKMCKQDAGTWRQQWAALSVPYTEWIKETTGQNSVVVRDSREHAMTLLKMAIELFTGQPFTLPVTFTVNVPVTITINPVEGA